MILRLEDNKNGVNNVKIARRLHKKNNIYKIKTLKYDKST